MLHQFTTCSIVQLKSLYRALSVTLHSQPPPSPSGYVSAVATKRHGNHHARIKIHPASAGLTHPSPGTPPETSSVEDSALWGGAVHNRHQTAPSPPTASHSPASLHAGPDAAFLSQPLSIPPSRRMDSITACTRWSISCTRLPAASGPIWPLVPSF